MVRWLRHVVEKTVYAVCTINRINLAAVHDGCVFCSFSKTTIEKIKFISHFLISFVFIENIEREKSVKKNCIVLPSFEAHCESLRTHV